MMTRYPWRHPWLPSLLIPRRHFIGLAKACATRSKGPAGVTAPTRIGTAVEAVHSDVDTASWAGANITVPAGCDLLLVFLGSGVLANTGITITMTSSVDGALDVASQKPSTLNNALACQVFSKVSPTVGVHTLTMAASGGSNLPDFQWRVCEFLDDVDTATPFCSDIDNISPSGTTATTLSGSITTDKDNSRLYAFGHILGNDSGPVTPGDSLTTIHDGTTGPSATTLDSTYCVAHKVVETAGASAYSMVWTGDDGAIAGGAIAVRGAT